jgi:hypothetical protein
LKLLGHRPGLPGDVISFYSVPLNSLQSTELSEDVPVRYVKDIIFVTCNSTPCTLMFLKIHPALVKEQMS